MVGLVIVSHSRALSMAVVELVRQVGGPELPIRGVGGVGAGRTELGTDAVEIAEAVEAVRGQEGVLVLVDLGSAVLSAETALELLPADGRSNVRLCAGPLVEGAVAAGVQVRLGRDLESVRREAQGALEAKIRHLAAADGPPAATAGRAAGEQPADYPQTEPPQRREITLTVTNRHGLHARPAARFVETAGAFDARIRVSKLGSATPPVPADSFNALVTLGVGCGDSVVVTAEGPDATAALEALAALVDRQLPEFEEETSAAAAPAAARPAAGQGLAAVALSEGIALGPVFQYRSSAPAASRGSVSDAGHEWACLMAAADAACDAIRRRQEATEVALGASRADIFGAHRLIVRDPSLLERARQRIYEEGENAAWAWQQAVEETADRFRRLEDEYLRRRADDVADAGRQVLVQLLGRPAAAAMELQRPSVLVAEDLAPTDVAALDGAQVLGIVTVAGGPTSHSAILAKALGIPAVAGAPSEVLALAPGTEVGLDGFDGRLWIDPPAAVAAGLATRRRDWLERRRQRIASGGRAAHTADGRQVVVAANIGAVADAAAAVQNGADGVGLLRTEFLYLGRDSAPSEAEQMDAIGRIAAAMGGRPVCVRTLDVGGDKPLAYLPVPAEKNPDLGLRAVRLALAQPEILRPQLRAILRAGASYDLRLMFPMIARVEEVEQLLEIRNQVHHELAAEGVVHRWPVLTGIMIETPAAALLMDAFAPRLDFFSIGTNDLTQYTLAAERGHAALADYADPMHPAILRLIRRVVDEAHRRAKPVTVCGEMASDPAAAAALVGMGVDELSVTPPAVGGIKAVVRRLTSGGTAALVEKMLETVSAGAARRLAQDYLETTEEGGRP